LHRDGTFEIITNVSTISSRPHFQPWSDHSGPAYSKKGLVARNEYKWKLFWHSNGKNLGLWVLTIDVKGHAGFLSGLSRGKGKMPLVRGMTGASHHCCHHGSQATVLSSLG
jgi:hypothetical protein